MRTRAIAAGEYELGLRDMVGRLEMNVMCDEFYADAPRPAIRDAIAGAWYADSACCVRAT